MENEYSEEFLDNFDFDDDFDISLETDAEVEDESVELNVYTDKEFTEAMSCEFSYPCLFLEGLGTEEELKYFRTKNWGEDSLLPLYSEVEGSAFFVNNINLDATTLLLLHEMGNYRLHLLKNENSKVLIDLDKPKDIVKFIRL